MFCVEENSPKRGNVYAIYVQMCIYYLYVIKGIRNVQFFTL